MQNEAASAVAATAVKVSPPWIITALAWGDANFPRILLALSILYTAAQLFIALRKIWRGKE
ncbi:hypothetical protein E5S69_31445 [Cupriavidus necator]|uniref:hypothetical protein n=1 Tax=Cupriavidus necator TaxID=106590 RepID=UPI00149030CF|nr:hypothetical protein [Cupriavidus necator]NOV28002.1 hypothetical protein [Cupriavidus necator]